MYDLFIFLDSIKSLKLDIPDASDTGSITIPLVAATEAILTASARPVYPFTTAISDISFNPSIFLAILKAVWYLSLPPTLSVVKLLDSNCFCTSFDTELDRPII